MDVLDFLNMLAHPSGTRDGRHMGMDAERQKLELVVDVARQIWA